MNEARQMRAAAALARLGPPDAFDRETGEARFRNWLDDVAEGRE